MISKNTCFLKYLVITDNANAQQCKVIFTKLSILLKENTINLCNK